MNKDIWSDDEINYLVNNYSYLTIKELKLNKTRRQIISQLNKLGLKYLTEKEKELKEWTKENDNYLINNYCNFTINQLAIYLNKDYHKIKRRIKYLKLDNISKGDRIVNNKLLNFDKKIIETVKEQSNYMILSNIAKINNMKCSEVKLICDKFNIKLKNKFELLEEIDKKILEIGEGKSISNISDILNLDYKLVFRRCQKLNINYINDYPKWNVLEKEKLLKLAIDTPLDDLALIMHRTKGSILENAKKLNIPIIKNKYIDTTNLSDIQLSFIKNNYSKLSLLELCKSLNKDSRTIILKLHLLNLYKKVNYGTSSLLENIIAKILDEYQIKYICQYKVSNDKNFKCDFLIKNTNKIIEVYGDFWHGYDIPNKKNDPRDLDSIRKNNFKREQFIINNNYELLIIWEHDIINNLENVYNLVKNYLDI